MTDHTPHPLDALNDQPEPATSGPQFSAIDATMDGITHGAAEVLTDLTQGIANFFKGSEPDKEKESEKDTEKANKQEPGRAGATEQTQSRAGATDQPEARSPDLTRERTLDPPQHIQDMVNDASMERQRDAAQQEARMYQRLSSNARLEAAEGREKRSEQERRHEAAQDPATPGVEPDKPDPYAKAAHELDAQPMKEGQEVEGEVLEVAQVDGENYYVVEQDGERMAVPAGSEPEHEAGDEITVTRSAEGFETGESYSHGL